MSICRKDDDAEEMALLARLTDGVNALPGVRMVGPEKLTDKCAIAALDFPALGTFPRGVVRCSFGHKNTEAEVDELLTALNRITKGRA